MGKAKLRKKEKNYLQQHTFEEQYSSHSTAE